MKVLKYIAIECKEWAIAIAEVCKEDKAAAYGFISHNCRTYLVIHWTAVCGYTFSLMHRGKNVNDQ